MSQQRKLECPICRHPRLTNLGRHLTTVHDISGKERKSLLRRARFSVLSMLPDQSIPKTDSTPEQFGKSLPKTPPLPIPKTDSTPEQFGKSLPKTPPLPEQEKLPNTVPFTSASDENEDELIPCPYDSRISYERIWGTNVPVMDYDIFKLHHPFSMLVAGPRGAGKSEFVKNS